MNLYLISARLTRHYQQISAPSQEVVTKIIHANSSGEAEQKYRADIAKRYANMPIKGVDYEFLMFADEIK